LSDGLNQERQPPREHQGFEQHGDTSAGLDTEAIDLAPGFANRPEYSGTAKCLPPRMQRVTAAILGVMALSTANAQDYPQWRGPSRDGVILDLEASGGWPAALNRRWRVKVGEGYATPVLVGKTIYTFTRQGESEVLQALDADSGAPLWSTGYEAPYTPSYPAAAHGAGPKATPLFHNGSLFTLGASGILSAFDATTGRVLWQRPAPSEPPIFNAASSPAGDGDLVFAHSGNYEPLTAFDAKMGEPRWTTGPPGFFASPIVSTLQGVRQVISAAQDGVIGAATADGALLWHFPVDGRDGATTPLLNGETIIVGTRQGGVVAFRPTRREGNWSTETAWTTRAVGFYLSTPVIAGETVFGFSTRGSGQFVALDARNGAVIWLGPPRQATNASLTLVGDYLLSLTDNGQLVVSTTNRDRLEMLRRYTVSDGSTWAHPVISGNSIFVKDTTTLTRWEVEP
jgi:outer membrane protein assembly factor BamB